MSHFCEHDSEYSNIYPTRCNVTQLILSGNCSTCFGWWYHPKHVEQFPDKINCVTLHLVGHTLEHVHRASRHSCQSSIKLIFSQQMVEKHSNISFMKTRPVGAEFSHANGRTDGPTEMTKLIVVFRNLWNAHNNRILFHCYQTCIQKHPRIIQLSTSKYVYFRTKRYTLNLNVYCNVVLKSNTTYYNRKYKYYKLNFFKSTRMCIFV